MPPDDVGPNRSNCAMAAISKRQENTRGEILTEHERM